MAAEHMGGGQHGGVATEGLFSPGSEVAHRQPEGLEFNTRYKPKAMNLLRHQAASDSNVLLRIKAERGTLSPKPEAATVAHRRPEEELG